ncbi:MAG TPA: hypothetical protein VGE15_01230 [Sphingobacteriaceae bacterium]
MEKHWGSTEKEAFITDDKSVLLGNVESPAGPAGLHTEASTVNDDFCGKGIENQLVTAVILHEKKINVHTPAHCTFTKTRFANDHDVSID